MKSKNIALKFDSRSFQENCWFTSSSCLHLAVSPPTTPPPTTPKKEIKSVCVCPKNKSKGKLSNHFFVHLSACADSPQPTSCCRYNVTNSSLILPVITVCVCVCVRSCAIDGCGPLILWPLVGLMAATAVALLCTVFYFSRESH